MSIEIGPGTYVARIFYAETSFPAGNVFGYVYRDQGEDFWRFRFRLRTYVDDDLTHASKDPKTGFAYQSEPGVELESLLKQTRFMFELAGEGKFDELVIDSDDPAVTMAILAKQSWAQINEHQRVPGEQ